ncbi:MAG: hypothetical protein K0Q49_1704 [Haloplasmataceae bacterium]|jgi:hypothetical protein|nr:hypothetical protein [Haloplasmataceae bacterium]
MKQRELFLDQILIDDAYSIKIDPKNNENLIIYENNTIIDEFSLKKRIYTLFKMIQELTDDQDFILLDQKIKLYGKEIKIKDDIYMKISESHVCLTVDFYKKVNNEIILYYLTKMTYMTQKLFNKMLIPEKMTNDENYQENNATEFKDMLEILSYPQTLSNA